MDAAAPRKELHLGFASIPLPAHVSGSLRRTPDGGAVVELSHEEWGELGIVRLTPRVGGIAVDAMMARPELVADLTARRTVFEPIARQVADAFELGVRTFKPTR